MSKNAAKHSEQCVLALGAGEVAEFNEEIARACQEWWGRVEARRG